MSVIGKAVKDTRPSESYQPVGLIDPQTGEAVGGASKPLQVAVSGGPTGPTVIAGQNGTGAASATNPLPTSDVQRVPLLHARASYTATPTGLPTPPAGATYAVIQCEGGVVKWTDDGSAPTATLGLTLSDGGELRYNGAITAMRIASKSGSPALCVAYYR